MYSTPAIVFDAQNQVSLQSLKLPDPRPDEVLIQTRYSCISGGTEGWILQGQFSWSPLPFPCVPGYQRVGVVEQLGSSVTDWHIGDRVMATLGHWEGPVQPFQGAHVARAATQVGELYRIPEGVSDLNACGTVVAQVGYNAASRPVLEPGDWVVVYGDGLIGQFAAQSARARGARVVLIGRRPERLELALKHSADAVVNARSEEVIPAVRALIGANHATAVLDTVQSEAVGREYVELLEFRRGQIVYCGFTPGKAWADMGLLQQRELTAHFVSGWSRERMEATLALMAQGKLDLEPLITHLEPPEKAPELYRMNAEKSGPFLGMVLDWTGGGA